MRADPSSASREHAIDLRDVAKVFRGRVHALRGIELQVRCGEIYGLLGPNGAGKTTLVKIMMTVVRPTRAEGTLLGEPIGHKPALRRVGYLPEGHRFPPYLTGRQAVRYCAALAGEPRRRRIRRADELLAMVGLAREADRKLRGYSKGMLQRMGLAQALVHDPHLVVLDEPTDGLDPVGRRDVRDLLLRLREEGKTIFLNSHLLGEVERVCERVAILRDGRVVRQGSLGDLTAARQRYEVSFASAAGEDLSARIAALFGPGQAGEGVRLVDGCVHVAGTDPHRVQPVIDAARAAGLVIREVRRAGQSLESLFIETIAAPPDAVAGDEGDRRC